MLDERRVTTDDGITIEYGDFGPREGRTVMLVHGLAAAGEQFFADAKAFAARGFRVLVPDLRGHGHSGKPALMRDEDFSIPRLAADMLDVLDDAGVGALDWVGNSLGGIIAFELVGRNAHRLRTLTTFGTAHKLDLPEMAAAAIPLGYKLLGGKLLAEIGGISTTRNLAARPLVTKLLREFDPQVGRAIAANVRRYDLTDNALAYPGPTLMVVGELDRPVNLALRATLPKFIGRDNFTLVDMPDAGHCANLDKPEEFRAVLERFWAGVGH